MEAGQGGPDAIVGLRDLLDKSKKQKEAAAEQEKEALPKHQAEEGDEEQLSYKLRAEKSLNVQVLLMSWSPKMDVIALGLADNSVRPRPWEVTPTQCPSPLR